MKTYKKSKVKIHRCKKQRRIINKMIRWIVLELSKIKIKLEISLIPLKMLIRIRVKVILEGLEHLAQSWKTINAAETKLLLDVASTP